MTTLMNWSDYGSSSSDEANSSAESSWHAPNKDSSCFPNHTNGADNLMVAKATSIMQSVKSTHMSGDSSTDVDSSDTEVSRKLGRKAASLGANGSSDSEPDSSATSTAAPSSEASSSPRNGQLFSGASVAMLLQWRVVLGACSNPLGERNGVAAVQTAELCNGTNSGKPGSKREKAALEKARKSKGKSDSVKAATTPSAESWAAVQRERKQSVKKQSKEAGGAAVQITSEEFTRKVRSVLNKLTVERFDKLSEQLADSGAQTPHHVAILVREIFEKATQQHNFISMYADLCARLEEDTRIVRAALTNSMQPDSFRRILLQQCQASFEDMLTGSEEWGNECCSDPEEIEARKARVKQKALGNVKLIGRLLVSGMLSSKLLITLCEDLVDSRESCHDALECLSAMLTVAGPTFDAEDWLLRDSLEAIFQQVKDFTSDKSVPPRIRFLFRDVLELRSNGWRDGKQATAQSKGPMTLQEVRKEATGQVTAPQRPRIETSETPKWSAQTPKFAAQTPREPLRSPSSVSQAKPIVKQVKVEPPQPEKKEEKKEVSATVRRRLQRKQSAARAAEAAAKEGGSSESSPVPADKVVAKEVSAAPTVVSAPYSRASFQQVLWQILRDLKENGDVQHAVARIENHCVPVANQPGELTDLITRASEEPSQPVRRSFFALASHLAAGGSQAGAFKQSACLEGIENFFLDVFDDLCADVTGLPSIMVKELVPALLEKALTKSQLADVVPPDLRC